VKAAQADCFSVTYGIVVTVLPRDAQVRPLGLNVTTHKMVHLQRRTCSSRMSYGANNERAAPSPLRLGLASPLAPCAHRSRDR
jgi:hypothetical protein